MIKGIYKVYIFDGGSKVGFIILRNGLRYYVKVEETFKTGIVTMHDNADTGLMITCINLNQTSEENNSPNPLQSDVIKDEKMNDFKD